jgi:hypothetical protein
MSDAPLRRTRPDQTRRTVYLHIGHGKTGTTALQTWLAAHEPVLKAHHLRYPRTARELDGHHRLAPLEGCAPGELWNAFRQELAVYGGFDFIISSEYLYYVTDEDLNELRRSLSDQDVVILLYVRPQVELLTSTFLQWVKVGADYGATPADFLRVHQPGFRFDAAVSRFRKVFPSARIVVRLYRDSLHGGTVVDFCRLMGLPDHESEGVSNANPSIPSCLWRIVHTLNQHGIDGPVRDAIIEELMNAPVPLHIDPGHVFSDEEIQDVREYYAEGNAALAPYFLSDTDAQEFVASTSPTRLRAGAAN